MSLLWMALVSLIGFLMVSTWRFWSGKEINLFHRHPFRLLIALYALFTGWLSFLRCCF